MELDELPLSRRRALALSVYRAMPCYANTMYVSSRFDAFGPVERRLLPSTARRMSRCDATSSSSAFDVCGQIDAPAAREWLGRLRLPPAELERLSSAVRSA